MTARTRLTSLPLILFVLAGCHNPNNAQSVPVLRRNLAIDLAQVSAFAVVSATNSSSQAAGGASAGKLYALTLSGDTLEVSLVEDGSTQGGGSVQQPQIRSIFPTTTWVLFSAHHFFVATKAGDPAIGCSIIAARRVDKALFCSSLAFDPAWSDHDPYTAVLANPAGDVVYLNAVDSPVTQQADIDPSTLRLYRVNLGGQDGPSATALFNTSLFMPLVSQINAAGDLYISYLPSTLANVPVCEILPIDGGTTFNVSGSENGSVMAGKAGETDENTFYVLTAGAGPGSPDRTIRVITKNGSSFVETEQPLNLADAGNYGNGLYRFSDGIYLFSATNKTLVRVIADAGLVANPTPIPLVGVDRITGLDSSARIFPVSGRWVFIAAIGNGYKFVRHDGVSQQDIPFDANIDVTSFDVSTDGAIDFLGFRTDTLEKIHGTVAAGETDVTISSAGVLDPVNVVTFTKIN